MKPISLKEEAISYRIKGYSYNMITQKIGVNKSTLSNWLNEIPFSPNNELIKRIGLAKLKSASFKHRQKIIEIEEMKNLAKTELGKITRRDLWLLGVGLYLGEVTKSYEFVRIVNSDPWVIKIAIRWFKEICGLKNENFSPMIHIYPDNNIQETIYYWSKITGIKKEQFGKVQIDKRINKIATKRNSLPHGTLHLHTRSLGEKELGRRLHRRIMGWI